MLNKKGTPIEKPNEIPMDRRHILLLIPSIFKRIN